MMADTNFNTDMLDCVRPFQQCLFNVIRCDKMAFTTERDIPKDNIDKILQ